MPTWRETRIADKCDCGRTLHSIREGESGECSSCWVKKMDPAKKKALNNLISLAFKPSTDAEKDAAVAAAQ